MSEIARLLDDLLADAVPRDELRHRVRLARGELERMERNMTDGRLYGQDSGPTSASGGTGVREAGVEPISDGKLAYLDGLGEPGLAPVLTSGEWQSIRARIDQERERAEKAEASLSRIIDFANGMGPDRARGITLLALIDEIATPAGTGAGDD